MSYLRYVQTNTSPFYGLGASSILSVAVNVSEDRSRCSQGEFLSTSPSVVAGAIAYLQRRTSLTLTSINQTRHRSRLALQPFLFRSVLFHLGSLYESTPRVCPWEQAIQVRPALVGRVPVSTRYCIAYCKCTVSSAPCFSLLTTIFFVLEQIWTAIVVFAPLLWTEIRWW